MTWDFLAVVSVAVSSASTFALLSSAASKIVVWRKDRRNAADAAADATEPISLDQLRGTLITSLGPLSIASYARAGSVRDDFDRTLSDIRQFLNQGETETPMRQPVLTEVEAESSIDPRLKQAYAEVDDGNEWNALARMRRELELRFAQLLDREPSELRMGAGQLLELLVRQGTISREAAQSLRYAIHVANRAIHGEDTNPGTALEAIDIANRFLLS